MLKATKDKVKAFLNRNSTSPKRMPGESFEDYKFRRNINNKALKKYLNGRLVWISAELKQNKDTLKIKKHLVNGTFNKQFHTLEAN